MPTKDECFDQFGLIAGESSTPTGCRMTVRSLRAGPFGWTREGCLEAFVDFLLAKAKEINERNRLAMARRSRLETPCGSHGTHAQSSLLRREIRASNGTKRRSRGRCSGCAPQGGPHLRPRLPVPDVGTPTVTVCVART